MRLINYTLPPTYRLSSPGCACFGDPPGHPRYFVRTIYTSHGNSPPYRTKNGQNVSAHFEYRGAYYSELEDVGKLFKPLPFEHERVQAWIADTFSYHQHCYQDPTVDGSWHDQTLIYPVPDYKLKHFHDDPRFSEDWRTGEKAQVARANAEIEAHATQVAIPDNHQATIIIRRHYLDFTPTNELINNPPAKIGNWWSTGDRPKPEDCPGQYGMEHPVNGKWCQWCGWSEGNKPNEKPNWNEIDRCGIWKVLGVTECNNCDGLVKCWGTGTQLEIKGDYTSLFPEPTSTDKNETQANEDEL